MKINQIDGLELTELCPKCHTPVNMVRHYVTYRCEACGAYLHHNDALLALDVDHIAEVRKKLLRNLKSMETMRRRYPLVRDGKLIKKTACRIKKQLGGWRSQQTRPT